MHFAFIIPALMIGNSLRIVITVLLYRLWGEIVLQNTWHIALGYAQIIFALTIFLVIGTVFSVPDEKKAEEKQ